MYLPPTDDVINTDSLDSMQCSCPPPGRLKSISLAPSSLTSLREEVVNCEVKTEGSSIFEEKSGGLREFLTEWVEKISTMILWGFEAKSRDYFRNKRHWQEKEEGSWEISKAFVGALDYLQGKVSKLQEYLNKIDFVNTWGTIATTVDFVSRDLVYVLLGSG